MSSGQEPYTSPFQVASTPHYLAMGRRLARSKEQKRKKARIGALLYVVVFVALLIITISNDSCATEQFRQGNLISLLTGDPTWGRHRLTMCGFVRTLTPEPFDVIPCQVWNLMPLTIVAAFALWFLVRDVARQAVGRH
jgi:hypothetical protein